MNRAAACLLLGLGISLAAFAAPAPDAKETAKKAVSVEDIKKAIDDLGSKRFAVRDRAKKFLMELGAPAEPYLEEALKNPDEEIANTAKVILERFQWGLYPDTPKAVRDLIEQFRSGTPEERQNAIGALLKIKEVPLATLRRLIAREDNEELREQMMARVHQQVREAIPALLARGDFDAAEGMLELLVGGPPALVGPDYAAFMYLRGKLDATIARFERQRLQKGEAGQRAAEILVYLYRCKNDWPAARRAAEESRNEELVERVLWQSFDWKGLAAAGRIQLGGFSGLGAAYDRLAGNRKGYDEKIEEIKKAAEDEMAAPNGRLRRAANALLLNNKANDAIKILADKQRELALVFDLLCAQMRYKEAFNLVDAARGRGTDPKEFNEIQIRRARTLSMLGDKDSAIQLFKKVAEEIKRPEDLELAVKLVKAEMRVGQARGDEDYKNLLVELATEHAAHSTTFFTPGQRGVFTLLVEPIFGDDKDVAQTWWSLFRKEQPDEKPLVAMKRVRDLLAGKLDRPKLDDWLAKMEKQPNVDISAPNLPPRLARTSSHRRYDAMAAAYRVAGDDKKTQEYLTKAAEKNGLAEGWIKLGDFLMGKKRYEEAGGAYAKAAKQTQTRTGPEVEIDDGEFVTHNRQNPALPTYLQARAAFRAGNVQEGKRLADLAHWLPLGDDAVRAALVEELNKRDWPEMARKEAGMLLKTGWWGEQNVSYANVLTFLGRLAAKEKDYLKAADYYEKCLVGCLRANASFVEPTAYLLVPESVRVYRARGLLARGKIEEALHEANADLAVMPGNIDLVVKIVPDLDKLGKKKEADALYEKVRDAWEKLSKDYPASALAHNSVAWVMANCRRDLDAALKHAQQAVKAEPKNAGYLDTLAEVHFRKGDRAKALELMRQCVTFDAKSAYFHRQLARFKDQPFDSPTPDEGDEEE